MFYFAVLAMILFYSLFFWRIISLHDKQPSGFGHETFKKELEGRVYHF